jgi:hypothetical protein
MSSQPTKQEPFSNSTSGYVSAAVSTLAKISRIKEEIDELHSYCLNTQSDAERMRKAKNKL